MAEAATVCNRVSRSLKRIIVVGPGCGSELCRALSGFGARVTGEGVRGRFGAVGDASQTSKLASKAPLPPTRKLKICPGGGGGPPLMLTRIIAIFFSRFEFWDGVRVRS